jgi:N-acetylmuramoyl-L-alanine amidase
VFSKIRLAQLVTPQKQVRTALVIGNGAYSTQGKLNNPPNDATDVAQALKELGFNITLLVDAGQSKMDEAVEKFGAQLKTGGVGVFYYAGHAIQASGENFLVPIGAEIKREQDMLYKTIPLGQIFGAMEDAGNSLNIVILDACRDNPYIRRRVRSILPGLASVREPEGMLIAFATAPGAVADDGDGRNSPYTSALLKHLRDPGLPVELMFKRVAGVVVDKTNRQQTPRMISSLIGDFSFNPSLPITLLPPSPSPSPSPSPLPSPLIQFQTPIDLPTSKRRTVVVIDPGHGGSDTGAIGQMGLKESDVTLDIGLKVATLLRQKNIEVVMTRDSDVDIDLEPRVDVAAKLGQKATAFVSIHANSISLDRSDVNGLETYYYGGGKSEMLNQTIHRSIIESVDIQDRRSRTARFYVLRKSPIPTSMVETGFVTGAEDSKKLSDPAFRSRMAQAIARGVLRYLA